MVLVLTFVLPLTTTTVELASWPGPAMDDVEATDGGPDPSEVATDDAKALEVSLREEPSATVGPACEDQG